MVACGFTGVEDEFTGGRNRNFFSAYSPNPNPEEMLRGLGAGVTPLEAPFDPESGAYEFRHHEHERGK